MAKGLQLAEPPVRQSKPIEKPKQTTKPKPVSKGEKFTQVAETEMTQFNKRVPKGVADGYAMLAIQTNKKVPELLAEALELLENKYGKS